MQTLVVWMQLVLPMQVSSLSGASCRSNAVHVGNAGHKELMDEYMLMASLDDRHIAKTYEAMFVSNMWSGVWPSHARPVGCTVGTSLA